MDKFDFKKSLGQNFLKDNNIIKKIVSSIMVEKDDLIIEIGPGAGALTKELKNLKSKLICFEIDVRLKDILEKYKDDKTTILFEDFLKVNLNNVIDKRMYNNIYIVANLPYYITTPIIKKIINSNLKPKEMVLMVQKEVGERFMAKPNSKLYNSLSVFLQYYFDIKLVTLVNKKCFLPAPKVDSIVLKFTEKKNKIKPKNEEFFFKLIKDSFKFKRKTLKNNLKNYNREMINNVFKKHGFNETIRAEQLSIEEFVKISNDLS